MVKERNVSEAVLSMQQEVEDQRLELIQLQQEIDDGVREFYGPDIKDLPTKLINFSRLIK